MRKLFSKKMLSHLSSYDTVLISFLIVGKVLFFYRDFTDANLVGIAAGSFAITMVVTCWTALFPNRIRSIMLITMDILLTFVLFANAIFYKFYNSFMTLSMLKQASQVQGVSDSLISVIEPSDIVLFADLFVIIPLFYITHMRKNSVASIIKHRSLRFLGYYTVGFVMLASLFSGIIETYGKESATQVHDNNLLLNNMGILSFHVADIVLGRQGSVEMTTQEIRKWNDIQQAKASKKHFGEAKDKNIIIIQMEALQQFVINTKVDGQEITPNMNKFIKSSMYFDNYFSQIAQGNTSDAEFMALNSLYPLATGSAYILKGDQDYHALPEVLSDESYKSYAYHAFNSDYYNRLHMYDTLGFEDYINKEDFEHHDGEKIGLGLSDEEMFKQSYEEIKKSGQKSMHFLISLSGHHPYEIPEEKKGLKITAGQFEPIFENYLQAQNYADRALGSFLDKLEQDGILDESIVVVYGDHFAPGLHADDMYKLLGKDKKPNIYESSELFKVPFIVRLPEGKAAGVVDNTGGQIDLYPTIINLLGLNKKETFYLGHDLLNAKSYAAFRTHIPSGSVVNNDYFYISMGDGVFENGTCYDRKTGTATEVNLCIEPYREAKNGIKTSDYILSQDNLEEIIDYKPGLDNVETKDTLFANTPNAWADHYTLIAHALGAIDGYSHTNSIDALITSYDKGHRVFEMDLITTSDGVLIGRHDWYEALYGKLYQEVSKEKFNNPLSLDEFLSLPINKKYTPMTAEQMLVILSQYPDMYIVTDTKTANSEEVHKQFSQLIALAKSIDPSILDRIIPQIYTENMHKAVDKLHPFKNYIYSLYINKYDNDRVLQYAKENKLGVVMMDEKRFSKKFVDQLAKAGIKTYMHTFNEVDKIKEYQKQGVIGVMTDQLTPSDMK